MDKRIHGEPFQALEVFLTDEEISAVDGWRKANGVGSRSEAVRELVRMGLLGEIGRIYRSVASHEDNNSES